MKQLLKSAYIWNQTSKEFSKEPQDILIENGFIKAIEKKISDAEAKEINYPNLHVSPAWFDPFVSFGEPGFEERETLSNGSLSALKSGFSGIGLCPNTNPVLSHKSDIDFIKRFETDLEISPIGALTKNFEGNELTDLFDISRAGAVAFYDFKKSVPNANVLKVALQYVKAFEGLIISFPEDKSLTGKAQVHEDDVTIHLGMKSSSAISETIQIERDLKLLEYTNSKLHIPYISTADSVEIIKKAKKKNPNLSCSTSINNLFFDTKNLKDFDQKYKVKPPLRNAKDREVLVQAVKEGIIDYVTSDHQPINIEIKDLEFENAAYGSIGLESFYPALNTLFGKEKAIDILIKNWQIFGQSTSHIKVGEKAEFSLFNPEIEQKFTKENIYSKSKNSIFLNESLKGKVYGLQIKDTHYGN